MKRWDIHAPSSSQYSESPDGEWVEWADVYQLLAELEAARRGPCAQCVEDVPLAKAAVLSILAELLTRFAKDAPLRDAVNEVVMLYAPEECTPP